MDTITGFNLLPATGEFGYDPLPYRASRWPPSAAERPFKPINTYAAPGSGRTDYSLALDALAEQVPGCTTVNLLVAWFGSSVDARVCRIYPSTIYIDGSFQRVDGPEPVEENWQVSGLTQLSRGPGGAPILIPITTVDGHAVYGGTPSDQTVVRCLRDLKARGYRVVFYPFLLMDCAGFPWRGRIGLDADGTAAAAATVARILGPAQPSQFTRHPDRLTVDYAGPADDYTLRRMILHCANLCVLAGGVDLFLLGSELRGLEAIRGPGWTRAGTTGADGTVTWDYPFVDGLGRLADDVRAIFDAAGLTRDAAALRNLITYSPDWSVWMGVQHPGEAGQWPHLDQLYGRDSIDLVAFDNYLPLSDWTTAGGGLDAANWAAPAPDRSRWPPGPDTMNGLGLSGEPTLYSMAYLKRNIEGGEKYDWFYVDSDNLGIGLDPLGSDQQVSRPTGDRVTQTRSRYYPGQEILANKQLRWWWKNPHRAVYDTGDGQGWVPRGPVTRWVPQSKSITTVEYGFGSIDRATNQPNVFYDPKSTESFTAFWSVWDSADGATYTPRRDDTLCAMALRAVYEYWYRDGHNEVSAAGLPMLQTAFFAVWNWDARPFPTFPLRSDVWGDTLNWPAGLWVSGKGPALPPPPRDPAPAPGPYPTFPALSGRAWSVRYAPVFRTGAAARVSGREARAARVRLPTWEIELAYDVLAVGEFAASGLGGDFERLAGFYGAVAGRALPFHVAVPPELGAGSSLLCRFADDDLDLEGFMALLFATQAFRLVSVRG
ncbi:hypothetical protein SB2_02700 [Methylobacterium radiotolerans]|nr:hypothetical protein SB3_16645 [Methylobacterium radiotolerans]KTS50518.1 hypothetical protein SB2_02700 [Methylobacterium radiotolerans]